MSSYYIETDDSETRIEVLKNLLKAKQAELTRLRASLDDQKSDFRRMGLHAEWLQKENKKLRASQEEAIGVCRAVVAEYEDTFISPDEMTGESHEIYMMAKAAIANATDVVLREAREIQ
jgi:hypothetical protein